jgi:Ca-activated chloride channel family protein
MFRFEQPYYLYVLLLIPVLTVFFILMRKARERALSLFGESALVNRLMPAVSRIKHQLKFGILMLSMLLIIIALANPQWGIAREKTKKRASDVMIALDISNSMLSDDVKPSRLDRARAFTLDLLQALRGERVGTIIFAGNAYLQMPLTADYSAAAMFIKSANPDQAPTQGTAISEAIDLAEKSFKNNPNKTQKVLILISDGENHDDDALARAQKARDKGMTIFTLGVGTAEGGLIPYNFDKRTDFKRDEKGEPIRTKLNEDMMRQLATAGGGDYYNLSSVSGIIPALKSKIDKMEKQESEQLMFNEYQTHFQWFAGFALLLILLEFAMPYRKSEWEEKDIFKI